MITATHIQVGLPQTLFAKLLGISKRTSQEGEQGQRKPSGAAQTLLKIAQRHPEVFQELGMSRCQVIYLTSSYRIDPLHHPLYWLGLMSPAYLLELTY